MGKNIGLVIYYAVLAILTLLMMRPEVEEYPLAIRMVYLGLVFAPLVYAKEFTPFAVTAFYTISYCSFVGLLPFSIVYPFAALLFLWLLTRVKIHIPAIYIIALSYFFVVSLLYFDFEETGVLWIGILMIMILSAYIRTEKELSLFAYGFVLVSFILGMVFLLNIEHFMYAYTHTAEDFDRSGWLNPNVFGGTIGCGTVIATNLILDGKKKSILLRLFLLATIVISFITLAMNASRGALIATALGSILFVILNKKMSITGKLLIIAASGVLIYILYKYSFLDLLVKRFQEEFDEESGGGRFLIWSKKLDLFAEMSPIKHLFGIGQIECIDLGRHIRTHNDFLTAYIAYGIVGVVFFIILLFRPFYSNFSFKKFFAILPYMVFLLTECFLLEPLMRGYFVFIAFFLFINKYCSLYFDKDAKKTMTNGR
ncbi:MAG: O-antigen ligase family protein [Bacteroidales bacterium]|nr:O-antigen ligase family protein [Bacteroidales bacterium]